MKNKQGMNIKKGISDRPAPAEPCFLGIDLYGSDDRQRELAGGASGTFMLETSNLH